jgi:predicted TIM-barrel fold metal-dependent hydrolase
VGRFYHRDRKRSRQCAPVGHRRCDEPARAANAPGAPCALELPSPSSYRSFSCRVSAAQPETDYHQHLFSPRIAKLAPGLNPLSAADLIALLDKAGIERAVVLSIAYQYSGANRPAIEDEYAKVREENDWTSQQVALYPERLRGFAASIRSRIMR